MSANASESRRLIALQRYADAMIDLLTRIMRELPITPENVSTAKIAHMGLKELQAHARACDPRGAEEKYAKEEARLMDAVLNAAVAEGDAEAGLSWDGRMYAATLESLSLLRHYRKTIEQREDAVRALREHRASGRKKGIRCRPENATYRTDAHGNYEDLYQILSERAAKEARRMKANKKKKAKAK